MTFTNSYLIRYRESKIARKRASGARTSTVYVRGFQGSVALESLGEGDLVIRKTSRMTSQSDLEAPRSGTNAEPTRERGHEERSRE